MTNTFNVGVDVRARMFTIRGHNKIMNEQHLETMLQIRDLYLPFHFMTAAYARYPGVFEKRKKRYQILKARLLGHQRPNVWSGALRLSVLKDSVCRSTPTRGTLQAKAPLTSTVPYGPNAGKRTRRPLTAQRRLEMEHVSQDETAAQCHRIGAAYVAGVYDPANSKIVLKQFR